MPGFAGWLTTPAGRVARLDSSLRPADRLGAWKARWGIGRMTYLLPPGLYALGRPDAAAPVLVTANYKMTVDILRRTLAGRDLWLLVLETHGINVWCAAGKGTFGTDELVRRIERSRLAEIVHHRRLLLPILGAPGVAAHEVQRRSGFDVRYATLRAADLPTFLDNGGITTPAMRELSFGLRERLVLIPVELVSAAKWSLLIAAALWLLTAIAGGGMAAGVAAAGAWLGAVLAGTALTPLLLPWLPGPYFSVKGALLGLLWALLWLALVPVSPAVAMAALLTLPAVSGFHALNFTGSTPFTSRSGVKREMRRSLPLLAAGVLGGGLCALLGVLL